MWEEEKNFRGGFFQVGDNKQFSAGWGNSPPDPPSRENPAHTP